MIGSPNYTRVVLDGDIEPVSVEQAFEHLKLDSVSPIYDSLEYDLVSSLITTARQCLETYLERSIVLKTLEAAYSTFTDALFLEFGPVNAIESVKYIDLDGTEQTLSASAYAVNPWSKPARVVPIYNTQWPYCRPTDDPVKIRYTAGYYDGSPAYIPLPKPIYQAILLLVGHFYENREAVVVANGFSSVAELPFGVTALVQPYRLGMGL